MVQKKAARVPAVACCMRSRTTRNRAKLPWRQKFAGCESGACKSSCGASPGHLHPVLASVPIHEGSFADAVLIAEPDLIHFHGLRLAHSKSAVLAAMERPVTLRPHAMELNAQNLRAWHFPPWAHAVYVLPDQFKAMKHADSRVRAQAVAFDTTLFQPFKSKDRRLVIGTAAAVPDNDIPFFFELAKRFPDHRFVFAALTCNRLESYADELRMIHRQMNSPAELMFDVPRETLAPLVARAGVYMHTARPSGPENAAGTSHSIAEAMATGAFVLVREMPGFADYVGDAGTTYRDLDHAVERIATMAAVPDDFWRDAWMRSVERAFQNHADVLVFRPMFEDWCALVGDLSRTGTAAASALPQFSRRS